MAARVGILVFDGAELLDVAGPLEVLAGLGCLTVGDRPQVQLHPGPRLCPDAALDAAPPFALLVVPGGPGARAPGPAADPRVAYLRRAFQAGALVASVCTGAFLLARAGLLDGRPATTHHRWRAALQSLAPACRVGTARLVDAGQIVTAAGVSSGIDLGLHLLRRLEGAAAARAEAERIEWPPPPEAATWR
jgi:transcriptional regulator GlxA family with amidase domain